MKTNVCILMLLGLVQTALSQGTIIGNVYYQSSGKKPAIGVKINAEGSNGDYSKVNGEYTLVFPQLSKGKTVNPYIGDKNSTVKDASGQIIELVNDKSLEYFTISENPADAPLKIIVCPKGSRDLAAQKYYHILKTSSDVALAKTKSDLINLLTQKDQDNAKIAELSAQVANLGNQVDSISLLTEAYNIASINKDDASERILRYIAMLDEGKSVQEAREVLNIKSAAKDLTESIKGFNAAVQELETRAGASATLYDYKDALTCFDTIIHYTEAMGINPTTIAGYYADAANVTYTDGKYEKALEYQQKSVDMKEKVLSSDHPSLAISYNYIAAIYRALGLYEEALVFNLKDIEILEKADMIEKQALSFAYNNIGSTYQVMGEYDKALEYYEKSLVIQEEILAADDPDLADGYASIAVTYQYLGQNEKSLEFDLKAITIKEKVLDAMDPDLALSYNNVAINYQNAGQYDKALEYILKAVKIKEKNLDPKHPELAISYDNLAVSYRLLKQYDKAMEFHLKSIAIKEEVYDAQHPSLAASYTITGYTCRAMGEYEMSLAYIQKAIKIQEKVLALDSPDLGLLYLGTALTYKDMKLFPEAIAFSEKSIPILKEAFPENHPYQKRASDLRWNLYYAKGLGEFERKEYAAALSDFKIVNAVKDSSDAWTYTGLCYYQLKDYPNAIAAYEKAALMAPEIKNQDFYSNIGMAYAKKKQLKEAKAALKAYETLFPDESITYRNWGMYYALQKDKAAAILNLQKAIELGFVDLTFLKEEEGLESIRKEVGFMELLRGLEKK